MKKVNARISFPNLSKKKKEHIFNAEKELKKAGISFDTGYDFEEKRRDWEFNSAKNVKVYLKNL